MKLPRPFRHPVLENWFPALLVVAAFMVVAALVKMLGWWVVAVIMASNAIIGVALAIYINRRPPF